VGALAETEDLVCADAEDSGDVREDLGVEAEMPTLVIAEDRLRDVQPSGQFDLRQIALLSQPSQPTADGLAVGKVEPLDSRHGFFLRRTNVPNYKADGRNRDGESSGTAIFFLTVLALYDNRGATPKIGRHDFPGEIGAGMRRGRSAGL